MKRMTFVAGLVFVGLAVVLGLELSRARAEAAEAYARERAAQRRAVAANRSVESAKSDVAPPGTTRAGKAACVTGLETFAVAVERSLVPLPDGRARRVAALKALSDAAVRAERTAELARPAPTLPRRLGIAGGEPVVADKRACDGGGYAELR